ncbi:MAG: VWA domain-containing protein [Candidatus Hodarchaeota archaeon]
MKNFDFKNRMTYSILILSLIIIFFPIMLNINAKKVQSAHAIPSVNPIDSNDVIISISKNNTGISQYSPLLFEVVVTNTISESVLNIEVYTEPISPYISLSPVIDPIPELTPDESIQLDFTAILQENITSVSVDLLLIIDASGSMGEEINSVKQEITTLTNTLSQEIPNLRIGIIIYGWIKYGENPITMYQSGNQLPFTSDFNAVRNFINSLEASGGDEPWGDALYLANNYWDWRSDSQKLIIMVGDEDCDPGNIVGRDETGDYYNGSQLVDEVHNLKEKGVIINTVVTDNPSGIVEDQFEWISRYTGGKSVYLPELQNQGIDLPDIIEEWTLELGREFFYEFNFTITWEDGLGNQYRNFAIEPFWLDLTFPSITVSENVKTIGLDLYNVEILATVDDFSAISFVNLYHNAEGSWSFMSMNPLPNSTNYLAEIINIPGGYNLSYSVEASDVLRNIGKTIDFWLIVEPPKMTIGQKTTIWAEPYDQVFSRIAFENNTVHYLILSGPKDIDSIIVNIIYPGSSDQSNPTVKYTQNVSSAVWRKIFPIEFTTGIHFLNMTIPQVQNNFSFSYVWLTLTDMSDSPIDTFSGIMTEKIRVKGLKWLAINETYFSLVFDYQSPLVAIGEVYTTEWTFLGQFSATFSFLIPKNATYHIIIWATLRTGEYKVYLNTEALTTDDPYRDYYQSGIGYSSSIPILALISLLFISRRANRRNKY